MALIRGADGELWAPDVFGEPQVSDLFVTVDDLDDDVAVLLVARWPRLARRGVLQFDDQRALVAVDRPVLQAELFRRRVEEGSPAAPRPLRVGDVVALRPPWGSDDELLAGRVDVQRDWEDLVAGLFEREAPGFVDVEALVDVSREARVAVKAAYYSAVAATLDDEQAEALGVFNRDDAGGR